MAFKAEGSGAVNAFGKVKATAFGETVYGGLNIYRIIVNTVPKSFTFTEQVSLLVVNITVP